RAGERACGYGGDAALAAPHRGLPDGGGPRSPADRRATRVGPRPADHHPDLPHAPQAGRDPPAAGPSRRADPAGGAAGEPPTRRSLQPRAAGSVVWNRCLVSLVAEAPGVAVTGLGSPPPRPRAVGFAPRPTAATWPETRLGRGEVVERLTSAPFAAGRADLQRKRVVGVEPLVDWLSEQPGGTWQQRWLGVEADTAGCAWSQVRSRWLAMRAQ